MCALSFLHRIEIDHLGAREVLVQVPTEYRSTQYYAILVPDRKQGYSIQRYHSTESPGSGFDGDVTPQISHAKNTFLTLTVARPSASDPPRRSSWGPGERRRIRPHSPPLPIPVPKHQLLETTPRLWLGLEVTLQKLTSVAIPTDDRYSHSSTPGCSFLGDE
ncbi:hypothetical protein N658DRAFT_27010 [Parathielavia hyrcaniae]|uniref:Uncharacterized protein n=1 Tax=Parathielavia hyrcaniae TaxID=113614 RepID=A0AAN6QAL5_9PEZI|nr:hypothetical protein N658DRAFT_27010 [Parathielavia hyrcaniae]